MKFLIVGLGSMGKRRIRNLLALGIKDIAGFDIREDRRKEAFEKYGIRTYDAFPEAWSAYKPDALVISTSPDKHMEYGYFCYEKNIHCFIEASVTDADRILELYHLTSKKPIVICPSCTMMYCAGPKQVKELVKKGVIGKALNVNYHTGQYLPDWHPWERVEDFYVSKRETGGCREIVPFELTWLNDLFGKPRVLCSTKTKLTDINADIDDIYHAILKYGDLLCNVTIEVIARPKAVCEMLMLGSKGIIEWSHEQNYVRYINDTMDNWETYSLEKGTVEKGYISMSPEEPYIQEMSDFIRAIEKKDKTLFPNDLFKDYQALETLLSIEKNCRE